MGIGQKFVAVKGGSNKLYMIKVSAEMVGLCCRITIESKLRKEKN